MIFTCPECNQYGMEWDGRSKSLVCAYHMSCGISITFKDASVSNPTKEEIEKVLDEVRNLKSKYNCEECMDTGCRCGGIGLTCSGCCNCSAVEA